MASAKKEYDALTNAVRQRDGALDREFHAAFPVIDTRSTSAHRRSP